MYTATKRSSGDPYLPPKPNSKRLHAGLKPSKRKSRKSSSTDLLQPNDSNNNVSISTEDLSKDIALAVATIIAESKMLQDDEDTDGESNNNETESIIKGEKEELSRPTSSTVPSAQIHMSDSHASSSDSKLNLAKFENENTNGSLVTCIASETATSVRSHHLPNPPTLPKGARLGDFMELTKYFLRVQNYMNNLG
ncbi:unnamed protein product [Orchesella dallaii]|uniref:Uncharacterized protein n=1 Tax=Orchesella dallaii TaxID=48710 RepID=A0ABP1QED0_9HEXA